MKSTLAIVLLWIFCAGFATLAQAVCVGASVNSFGARGDGITDDTTAIRSAINATTSAGGRSVVFNVARYYTTGTFLVPQGVVLCGAIEGPFDVVGVNPATTTVAPTLLITNARGLHMAHPVRPLRFYLCYLVFRNTNELSVWEWIRCLSRMPETSPTQWNIPDDLIPEPITRRDGRGRPWKTRRAVLNGVLWVLRTGAPWAEVPDRYPSYQTCHRRFQQWVRSGVMKGVLDALALDLKIRGALDVEESFIDGTFAPAKKGAPR